MLFTVYIIVLLGTLLSLGSLSDYEAVDPCCSGLATGTVAYGFFLLAHGVGLLFAARALQGLAVRLMAGAPPLRCTTCGHTAAPAPLLSSAAPTGGQALGAIAASVLAQ